MLKNGKSQLGNANFVIQTEHILLYMKTSDLLHTIGNMFPWDTLSSGIME